MRRLGGDERAARVSVLACGGLIVVSALPLAGSLQWPLAFAIAIANLPAFIGILALISGAASEAEQGWAMGIGASMTALSFFLSGLLAPALAIVPMPLLLAAGGVMVAAAAWPLRGAVRAQAALAAG